MVCGSREAGLARRGPNVGRVESEKTCRFFSDAHYDPDSGLAVRPLRALDKSCGGDGLCAPHVSTAVSNRQRVEEQEVPQVSAERRRALAGDGFDEQQPPAHRPYIPAAAACSAMIILAQEKSPAAEFNHHSMLT